MILIIEALWNYDFTKYPLYRGNKKIAWGIEKKEDIKDFQKGDLITPPCGLANLSIECCRSRLSKLNRIAGKITD